MFKGERIFFIKTYNALHAKIFQNKMQFTENTDGREVGCGILAFLYECRKA